MRKDQNTGEKEGEELMFTLTGAVILQGKLLLPLV
jgi:hypothetical protein